MRLFRRRHAPVTREDATLAIRHHMAVFGYDLSDYTDDEIQTGVSHFCEVIQASKFTTQEVISALTTMYAK